MPIMLRALQGTARFADWVTNLSAKPTFLLIHVLWFAVWIGTAGFHTDPYPYGFLTLVVSLEAIFLSLLILSSQQGQARAEQVKVDLQRQQVEEDLTTDREALALLKQIADTLGL